MMMFEAFGAYGYIVIGALVVGIIGVIASIIEQKHRLSHQASEVMPMVEFPAMVKQTAAGTWTAAIVGENSVLGTGATREESLVDLQKGVAGLVEYLKRVPQSK